MLPAESKSLQRKGTDYLSTTAFTKNYEAIISNCTWVIYFRRRGLTRHIPCGKNP